GIDGNFNTAIDWSTGTVPTANDDVVISPTGTYTVTVSTNHTIRSLSTASGATVAVTARNFTITHGTGAGASFGTIDIGNVAALTCGGTFNNRGKIELNSTGRNTGLVIAANATLTGGGAIILSAGGHNFISGNRSLNPFQPPITLTNAANTIEGAGVIGTNLALVNEAAI